MSEYYTAKRTRNIYSPSDTAPFKLSRSKIDLFIECPKCFYMDRRLGVGRPPGFPFSLNSAVDSLLKQEFDTHRAKGIQHPLQKRYGINAIPVHHEELNIWRENFKGVQFFHEATNFIITGAIDDLWMDESTKEYIVVDYKSTSKDEEITELNKGWQDGYKRQMEVYQWLLRANGLKVSNTGYFVYCNGKADREAFDAKLEFDITLIAYEGDDTWIEPVLKKIKKALDADRAPKSAGACDYCAYREAATQVLEE